MPIPIAAALAGLQLAGNLGSTLINVKATKDINEKQQAYNEQMYQRQRADALTDWDKQNAYNSPSQQMQRYKEAGLNPNLVYGQMSNSPVIRSTEAKAPDFVAPRVDTNIVGNSIGTYLQLKQQQQAIALMEEETRGKKIANDNLEDKSPWLLEQTQQNALLTGKQVENIMVDIQQKKNMNPLLLDNMKESIKSMVQSRQYQQLTQDQQIALNKAVTEITNAKLNGQNIENLIRQKELDLFQNFGLNKNIFSDLLKIGISYFLK